jgi:hypothetical protein
MNLHVLTSKANNIINNIQMCVSEKHFHKSPLQGGMNKQGIHGTTKNDAILVKHKCRPKICHGGKCQNVMGIRSLM